MAVNVIIVDNDSLIRGYLRSILMGVGADVWQAASGLEAISLAAKTKAGLVLLDLDMPGLNGLVTCEKLRALPGYERTPIVILSALADEGARRAATAVGATDFIAKPFRPATLLQSVAQFLKIDVSTREALTKAAERSSRISALEAHRVGGERLP